MDVAALLPALRAAGLGSIRAAAGAFLPRPGRDAAARKRRDAVRVLDRGTGELRPLTSEEADHIRQALAGHR